MSEETPEAVAVVGMACRLPAADSVEALWTMLRAGTEGIVRYAPEELISAGADPVLVRRPDFVPARGPLAGARTFDWSFFGYSRAEAATMDPQHRAFLQCASEAIDDAGIDPGRFPGWIGVYAGAEGTAARPDGDVDPLARIIGQRQDFLTSRVAYKLGLRGPAVTVQTACSTSLTAVHIAVQSLLSHECDAALAGGVSIAPPGEWGYLYQEGGILSPDGHCRPFDVDAAGTVPGEGVGVVVLKRLADAVRDGDRIAAVIRGSAVNNDGADKIGFTAPSVAGQRDAILLAQRVAAVDPADIDYVEAHGTGTRIGDPVEVQALTDAFRTAGEATGWCRIGAIKSNIGHTGSAAGVAGLIKTVLMLERGELVPTLHFRSPNPLLKLETTPFEMCAAGGPWPQRGTRLAAVSSFGVGGTNAHVVLAEAPRRTRLAGAGRVHVVPVSAASAGGLAALRSSLADRLGDGPGAALAEAARTLAGRRRFACRQAFVAGSADEAERLLRAAEPVPRTLGDVAFLLPGQGTLRHAAGAAAYRLLPGFPGYFDEVGGAARACWGIDLSPVVRDDGTPPEWFADTVHQQLGLLALGYGLGRQLLDWGLGPAAMVGNSIGEYAAAALAGVWTTAQAVDVVYHRACAMRDTEPGSMIAVDADPDVIAARLDPDHRVTVAVIGPGRTVLSGPRAVMADLVAGEALQGLPVRRLATERAFHSPAMRPAVQALRAAVAATPNHGPSLPLVSTLTGQWAQPDELRTPDYWTEQLCRTVRLDAALSTALDAGCRTFVELGPGMSMASAVRRHRDWSPEHVAVPLLDGPGGDGERALLGALGTLWELGADLELDHLYGADRPLRCSLPAHPFDASDPDEVPPPTRDTAAVRPARVAPASSERATLEAVWSRTLGVSAVAEDDDFFALGGESLMAVTLMSRAREATGAGVTVAEFVREATFGNLCALVRRDRAAQAPTVPGLVPLAPGGSGRPLFLAADSMDTVGSCRLLAEALDADRPVYGLEPVWPRREAPSIEALAARHVAAVLRVQPTGPYTVGGWSFGAVVAHEMAGQLVARGAVVDAMVGIDGAVPYRHGLPVATSPRHLAANLRLGLGAALAVGPAGARLRGNPELRRRFVANLGMLLRYRPRPVRCRAVLLPAGPDTAEVQRLRRTAAALYREVTVRPVPGDHWSILTRPRVTELARVLRAALSEPDPTGKG